MARLGLMNATLGLALGCLLSAGCGGDDTDDSSGDASIADAGKADAGSASDAAVAKGNATAGQPLVATKFVCGTCHTGQAGLLAGQSSGTKGPNITPDTSTGIGSWTEAQIITAVLTGKDDEGKQLCANMPIYGSQMTATEAADIAAYLKSIPAIKNMSVEACP